MVPKDGDLDMASTSFSPGVRRMMGRVGAKEPFEEGQRDLEELAGVAVSTKAVERVSEGIGSEVEGLWKREREQAFSEKIVPFASPPAPTMYVAMDGTGVPVLPSEVEGRRGKEGGQAKTREAKLGCVFSQTRHDEQGRALRDPESTTYVGAIEEAAAFGARIYTEAARRGATRAPRLVVLGDGAPWIWGIAAEHFHQAIQIVDLYHARQRLSDLSKTILGLDSPQTQQWVRLNQELLDHGDVEAVLASMRQLPARDDIARKARKTSIRYFQKNAERLRYACFRSQGLFIGSGVIEAGCKTIIGQRLKQSGMRWTVRGANAIIALRCCQLSNRWEEFWRPAQQDSEPLPTFLTYTRDNIHSHDVTLFIERFLDAPRCGEVYNIGGGRDNSCSILEAFDQVASLTGKTMNYEYVDKNREGDHICYISDLSKMTTDYPGWSITLSLGNILDQIVRARHSECL